MTANSENNDKPLTTNSNPTDDEDITFFFFYGLVKQLVLKRYDIGGKFQYNNTNMYVLYRLFIIYNNNGI